MTDDMILQALARLEGKVDGLIASNAGQRESIARIQVQLENTTRAVSDNASRIGVLESFRFRILGAVALGGALGGVVAALIGAVL